MPFPLSYRSKIEFLLHCDPDMTVEQYYADASYKISRKFFFDADLKITAADGKLVVAYTLKFIKPLIMCGVLVLAYHGIYYLEFGWAELTRLSQTWGRPKGGPPLSFINIASSMGLMWLCFFGVMYASVVIQFRALLKDTWKRMVLSSDAEIKPSVDQKF